MHGALKPDNVFMFTVHSTVIAKIADVGCWVFSIARLTVRLYGLSSDKGLVCLQYSHLLRQSA